MGNTRKLLEKLLDGFKYSSKIKLFLMKVNGWKLYILIVTRF